MFIFYLLTSTSAITTSECIDITCGTGITSEECVLVTDSKIEVRGCKAGYYCDYSVLGEVGEWKNATCKYLYSRINTCAYPQTELKAGFYCCKDSECKSGSCTSNRCKGESNGAKCQTSSECGKDLYCKDSSKCEPVKDLNEKCTEDNECKAGTVCNKNECTKMLSLNPGDKADNPKACISNFAYQGICDNIEVYKGGKKLEEPYECDIGEECTYKLTEGEGIYTTGKCVCGGNSSDTGYCSEYIRYRVDANQMYDEMKYSKSECSGSNAHSLDPDILYMCDSIDFYTYLKYHKYMGQLLYHSLFSDKSLDHCSMAAGLYDPYYSFKVKESFSLGLCLAWTILIVS